MDDLWPGGPSATVSVGSVRRFFDGQHTLRVSRGGYDEPIPVPKAASAIVDDAIRSAVREGRLWLSASPVSLLGEDVPPGLLTETAELLAPPAPLSLLSLLPEQVPEAWRDGSLDGWSLTTALSQLAGRTLPWKTISAALESAFRSGLLERTPDSGPWPCDYAGAKLLTVTVGRDTPQSRQPVAPKTKSASLRADQLQDLVDILPNLLKAAAGYDLRFRVQVENSGKRTLDEAAKQAVNAVLESVDPGLTIE